MSRYTRGLPIAGTIAIMALAAGLAPADDWTLKFEDTFEREELGEDWWASGLARIQDGELVIGREDDQGRNLVFCQREFEGAIRLEYDAMAPVDEPCDLSAIINGTEGGYATGYFFGFGSQNNTVGRFLLKGQPGMEYAATITPHTWHHVVCERFGHRFRHIIDGETVLDYTHEDPLPGPMNRKVGFYVWHKGHFDNVRVFTRPEEVNVAAAVAQSLPSDELQVSSRVYPAAGKIGLSVDVPPLEGIEQVRLKAVLNSAETDVAVGGVERLTVPNIREELIFDARDWAVGSYVALVGLRDAHGELLGDVATVIVRWPGRDRRFEDVKALNNLVWELLNATADEGDLTGMHEFSVPIQRWLYIRTTAEVGDGAVSIILDSDDPADAVTVHDGSQRVMVAKRRVEAGEHFVQVSAEGDARLTQLEVRAIPDVQHSRYPTTVYHIEANPEYDWEFISRHILPSATTIITSGDPSGIEDRVRQWIDQGGRWIVYTSRPGLHGHREIEETGQRLFEHYSTKPGFAHPLMDGVLVDEFYTPNDPAYPSYIEMAKLLRREYPEKGFFPYVAGKFGLDEGSVRFAEACTAADGMICREAYLAEWPTLPQALDYMRRAPERMLFQFEDSLPDVTFETVWVPGTFSFPWPFADGFPQCNYNAYLDMQFQMLATHPAFFGLGGVHIWRSGYTDEERLRWIGRFFEHYCIEGNTSRVTADPYVLEHIANPDFTEGLDGWMVQPAAEGSIEAGEREGLGSLQGRHYRGNDTFALMERSAERPNVLRQTVTGLRVGRTYSAKVLFGDYGDLLDGTSRNARHSLSVRLDGVELIEGGKYAYHEVYPTRARVGQFTREHPYFVNMRWQVFRATSTTATLTISDWASPDEPGGPAGQRLWMNFIEVKPYLMD